MPAREPAPRDHDRRIRRVTQGRCAERPDERCRRRRTCADVQELAEANVLGEVPYCLTEKVSISDTDGAYAIEATGIGGRRFVGCGTVGFEIILAADYVVIDPGHARYGDVDAIWRPSRCGPFWFGAESGAWEDHCRP